jgi:branched-subunit amino acid aminotransferase/4-amino-4-deoxychorismate lyase
VKSAPRAWLRRNGSWQPDATLPLTDRGVRYGMSVFETIGIRGGQPLLLAEHLTLLAAGADALLSTSLPDLQLPPLAPEATGILRLYLTAGDGAPTAPVAEPRLFALFEPHDPAGMPDEQTARLHPEPVTPFAHGRKTANYWLNCAAQTSAQNAGCDHSLLADHEGNLLSAALGNIFFVLDGQLCTPSLALAVRAGVIRSRILQSQPVREVKFPAARLPEATELFLTNSRLGVMPLQCAAITPGPLGRSLRQTLVRENIVP